MCVCFCVWVWVFRLPVNFKAVIKATLSMDLSTYLHTCLHTYIHTYIQVNLKAVIKATGQADWAKGVVVRWGRVCTHAAKSAADVVCPVCNSGDREDQMILCDKCPSGYHLDCVHPPLTAVPEGDWYVYI